MARTYTLHTDESGKFEGDMGRGYRLIAGLILPEMTRGEVERARDALLDIAEEIGGGRSRGSLPGRAGDSVTNLQTQARRAT